MLRLFLHDPGTQPLIDRRIIIVVPPAAMPVQHPFLCGIQHFRIFLRQPCRRCRGGRSKDHLHTFLFAQIQKFIKKPEFKLSLLRLDFIPCELRDTDYRDTGIPHSLQIFRPQLFIPMLRIIAGTHRHLHPPVILFTVHFYFLLSNTGGIYSPA